MIKIEDKITDTHVYFWGDPTLSNWGPAEFKHKGNHFYNSEQAFMWEKADFFGDKEIADKILKTSNPKEAKDLGRMVKGYSDAEWSKVRYKKMLEACLSKFSQNPDRLETLLSTGDRTLVEGSPYDKVWGVGWHWADPEILFEENWKGQNLLGKVLMEVRDKLK
jgi:ribA/ribD-fused uncharacterized protein